MMESISEKSTLIIAGAFNPAILTPQWIARNVLQRPPSEEFSVEVTAPLIGVAGLPPLPRFKFDGLDVSSSFQSLAFFLQGLDLAGCDRVCGVAATILQLLPHTPVTGVGFNFGFMAQQPGIALLRTLPTVTEVPEALGEGSQVVGRSWSTVVTWKDSLFTLQCDNRGGSVTADLNFHYPVSSAAAAEAVLRRGGVYEAHRAAAECVVAAISHERKA